jgi:hypothetical protein
VVVLVVLLSVEVPPASLPVSVAVDDSRDVVVVLLVVELVEPPGTTTVVGELVEGASRSIIVVELVAGAPPGTTTVLVVSAGRLANITIAPMMSAKTTSPIIKAELLVERASVSTAIKTISSIHKTAAQG